MLDKVTKSIFSIRGTKHSLVVIIAVFLTAALYSIIFSQVASAITYTQIGNYTGPYTTSGNVVTIPASNGTVRIEFCKSNMVRVRMVKSGDSFMANETYTNAIVNYNWPAVSFSVTDQGTYLKLSASGLVIRVQKNPIVISYYESNETSLITSNSDINSMAWDQGGTQKIVSFDTDAAGLQEHFYGLGIQGTSFDWRGKNFRLWLSEMNIHTIIPFFMSTRGYGIYLHSAWDGNFDFTGSSYNVTVKGGELDYYLIYGPDFTNILTNFSELTGKQSMPPKHALGLQFRGKSNWTTSDFLNCADNFRLRNIPLATLGVEPGWQTGSYPCTYVWNTSNFPNPASFISSIHSKNLKVNLWEHPFVSTNSPIYNSILPYTSSNETVAWGKTPDFTMSQAVDVYWNYHKSNIIDLGVDGFKVDETDGFLQASSTWPSGITGNEYHNLIGLLTSSMYQNKYRSVYGKRTFLLSRGNYTGTQRYPNSSYSDVYELDQYIRNVVNSGFTGAYFTPELRGDNEPNENLYIRRLQLDFLTPYPLDNEWQNGNAPWSRSANALNNYVVYDKLHMSLIPYIYSYFREQNQTGNGLIKPLIMEYQNDANTFQIDNEYLFGRELLIAPVNSSASVATRSIYLPQGYWIDYWNGYVYNGNQTINYTSNVNTMPIFVKAGSIIPLSFDKQYPDENMNNDLKLDVYASNFAGTSTFKLYEDDGSTFDYESGEYCETNYTVSKNGSTLTVSIGARSSGYTPPARNYVLQLHYRSKPASVYLNETALTEKTSLAALQLSADGWFYDNSPNDAQKITYVKLPDNGAANTIVLSVGNESVQDPNPPPVQPIDTVYEAESSSNTLNGVATVINNPSMSGGQGVGLLGNNTSNWLRFNNINVPVSGYYQIDINFTNGDGSIRYATMDINSSQGIRLPFKSMGNWNILGLKSMVLYLNAGSNTIKFYSTDSGWCPDIDRLTVSNSPISAAGPEGYRYEAESPFNLRSGQAAVVGRVLYSEGAGVGAVGGNADNWLQFSNIFVPATGPYNMYIAYANGDEENRSAYCSINGGAGIRLDYPKTGSFDVPSSMQITVYLQEGLNTIRFYNSSGWGPDYDYIAIPGIESPGQTILYSCDFSTTFGNWQYSGGNWNVSNGKLCESASGLDFIALDGSTGWDNYSVQADFTYVSGIDIGLVFWAKDSSNYFMFRPWYNNGNAGIYKRTNGIYSTLCEESSILIPSGTHTFRVECYGPEIRCYVDNILFITYTYDNEEDCFGKIGLRVSSSSSIQYDNVQVFE